MAIEPERIGALAMEFMESLEERFADDAKIDAIAIIVAVEFDQGQHTHVEWNFRRGDGGNVPVHLARGLLAEADRGITTAAGGG